MPSCSELCGDADRDLQPGLGSNVTEIMSLDFKPYNSEADVFHQKPF